MSIYAIYRVCIWLPILVPAALILVVNAVGARLAVDVGLVGERIAYSLIWGGLPYAVLAAWATWWVRARPEAAITRLQNACKLIQLLDTRPLACDYLALMDLLCCLAMTLLGRLKLAARVDCGMNRSSARLRRP